MICKNIRTRRPAKLSQGQEMLKIEQQCLDEISRKENNFFFCNLVEELQEIFTTDHFNGRGMVEHLSQIQV